MLFTTITRGLAGELRPADILIHRRANKFPEAQLSWIIKQFEPWWDRAGWHMSYVEYVGMRDGKSCVPIIVESADGKVHRRALRSDEEVQVYRWFDKPPEAFELSLFGDGYIGSNYDVTCYFWTGLQYLILHHFSHSIPRILNNRFTCWELVFLMCREMGKPIQTPIKYPMITDFIKATKGKGIRIL